MLCSVHFYPSGSNHIPCTLLSVLLVPKPCPPSPPLPLPPPAPTPPLSSLQPSKPYAALRHPIACTIARSPTHYHFILTAMVPVF
jgi:hypothetical protein